MKQIIGTGVLNWNSIERIGDRYGVIFLADSLPCRRSNLVVDPALVGQSGRLVAKILENRKSEHIGDLFHRVFPRTPEVGAEIELGNGEFLIETDQQLGLVVGLRPHDGRESLWLDIRGLYDCHEQTVELSFEPL